MSVPRRRALHMFFLLVFLGFGNFLWASGTREDLLSQAEVLVEEMEYNDAILLLAEVMRDDPEKFEEAQALLERIRTAREYYNEKYKDLIEAYQGNLEEAYPIIQELEELDPTPNEAAAESLKLAKETAGFVYNNNRFLAIMDNAEELLADGRYYEAIGVYATGFDLSRDIFEDENYGNIIESMVNRLAAALQTTVSEVLSAGGSLDTVTGDLQRAFEQGGAFSTLLPSFMDQAGAMNDRRETLSLLARDFLSMEEQIRIQRDDEKQVHYLVFLNRLLEGRADAASPEGILYALERVWTGRMGAVDTAAWDGLREAYRQTEDAYVSGDMAGLPGYVENLDRYAEACAVFLSTWTHGLYMDAGFTPTSFVGNLITEKVPRYRTALLLKDVASGFTTLAGLRDDLANRGAELFDFSTVEEVDTLLENLAALENSLREQRNYWEEKIRQVDVYAEGPGDFAYPKELAENMLRLTRQEEAVALAVRTDAVDMKADFLLQPVRDVYTAAAEEIDRGRELLEGIVETRGEGEQAAEVVFHYPDQALDLFNAASEELSTLDDDFREVSDVLQAEKEEVRRSEKISLRAAEREALARRVEEEMQRAETLAAEAEEKIFLAARYRQEGEQRLEEARQLTERNQFTAAKERLVAAADRFDESLFYQEDPELRTLRDEGIATLYEEINDAENALVIREVRDYIIQGKSLYSRGEFGQAQSVLLKAENRWSDTNVEPNPEIDYWLSLTQTALSVTSGREIQETDPLYAEMSQYLNQARADYRTGKKLVDEGKKEESDFYFNRAEKNILYVQQYFPFNKEARVLNLLISQVRDEKQFQELFSKDFTEARRLIATNPQKAYIDLKDLETIDPDFPGMAQAILEAEYAAGIKVRPPDRTKINKSRELYDDANRIYTNGNRAQYPLALSLLDEAISLNPDNIPAIRLKDTISVETGGRSTSVFSNEDQQIYLEAVNAFTAGNYLKASTLVDILLQNPDNQRNSKLLELQERIEAVR